jgi:hypothetical protein
VVRTCLGEHRLAHNHRCPPRDHFRPVAFDQHLEDQNRRGAADGPLLYDAYLAAQNREPLPIPQLVPVCPPPAAPQHDSADNSPAPRAAEPSPGPFHIDGPRLSDLPPVARQTIDHRTRLVYQVKIPFQAGRVIDLLT